MGQTIPKFVSEKFSEIEREQLEAHYKSLLTSNSSHIEEKTFIKHFLKEEPDLSKYLWRAFDFDRDGKVGRTDFLQGMAVCLRTAEEYRRKFLFRMFVDRSSPEKAPIGLLKQFFPDEKASSVLCEAMWDFDKQHEKELGIKKGEVVAVIHKYDNTWWLVQNKQGEIGYVAAAYVKIIETPPTGLDALPNENGYITLEQFCTWAENSEGIQKLIEDISRFSIQPPPAFELSPPTNFRHQTHIGFNSTGGFEFTALPDEWKRLFTKAGITADQAADPETAKFLVQVLHQERAKQQNRKAGLDQISDSTEPPQDLPPTPDLPPPQESLQEIEEDPYQPQEPQQPPEEVLNDETTHTGVPLPPQPPPAPSRPTVNQVEKMPEPQFVNMFSEISAKKLKPVDPSQVRLDNLDEQEANDLISILKKAMYARRPDLDVPEEKQENDDEWNE